MRVMLGVLRPVRGEVLFDGRPVDEEDRRRWGMKRGLYPGMPVGDQVVHFGRLHGLSRHEATTRARALLEARARGPLGRPHGQGSPAAYSAAAGGDLARPRPAVIVLDEPFSGSRPGRGGEPVVTLRQRAPRRCTCCSRATARPRPDLCEEIVMVDHGRTVLSGEVAQAACRLRAPSDSDCTCSLVTGAG